MYPAKLSLDGKIVRDELPNWSEILKENRICDFLHIDQQPSHCDNTDHDFHSYSHSAMDTHECGEDIDRERQTPFSRYTVPDQNTSSPVTSQKNADTTVNSERISSTQHTEGQYNPSSTCTNTDNHVTDLQCLGAASISENSVKSPQNPFFRPFNSDTAESSNFENPKRAVPGVVTHYPYRAQNQFRRYPE